MSDPAPLVDLGFTNEKFPAGTHICQIYSDDEERNKSLMAYLKSGIESGERTACFSENISEEALAEFLESNGISLKEAKASGNLSLAGTSEVYFQNNKFIPERMLGLLTQFDEASKEAGCPACRVIGEMSPEIEDIEDGNRLLEYESRVTLLLKEHPVTSVCQYNANDFNGATIMDVIKVHPLMIVSGSVVKNPFFIPPEEYLMDLERQ